MRNLGHKRDMAFHYTSDIPALKHGKGLAYQARLARFQDQDTLSYACASAGAESGAGDNRFAERGVRYRRRSKSAVDLDTPVDEQGAHEAGAVQTVGGQKSIGKQSPHGSKRSSFEAGIQDAIDSPRQSIEKMQRQASRNDFLPAELVQRSHLFNKH